MKSRPIDRADFVAAMNPPFNRRSARWTQRSRSGNGHEGTHHETPPHRRSCAGTLWRCRQRADDCARANPFTHARRSGGCAPPPTRNRQPRRPARSAPPTPRRRASRASRAKRPSPIASPRRGPTWPPRTSADRRARTRNSLARSSRTTSSNASPARNKARVNREFVLVDRIRRRMRLRSGALPYRVAADVRALLPLPVLPARDGQRVCAECADRDRSHGIDRECACACVGSHGQWPAASHLSMRGVSDCRLERIRRRGQTPLRASGHARRPPCARAGRSYLYAIESSVGLVARASSCVRRLLRPEETLAGGESRTAPVDFALASAGGREDCGERARRGAFPSRALARNARMKQIFGRGLSSGESWSRTVPLRGRFHRIEDPPQ